LKPTLRIKPVQIILAALFILLLIRAESTAENYTEGFDTTTPSCRILYDKSRLKLISHQRHTTRHSGRSSERVLLKAFQPGRIQLEQTLPGARVIDELTLSLWVYSNQPGAVLFLRLVFPHQTDPRTKKTLKTYLQGDQYAKAGRWQKLQCTAQEDEIRKQIVQLRAQLNDPMIDTRDLYIDRMVLTAPVRPGVAELFVDELQFGPVIKLQSQAVVETVSNEEFQPSFPVEFILDRLLVNGRPFFLRLAAYHNERLDVLKDTGINLVWVPNYQDRDLLSGLKRRGLWATATPPRADAEKQGNKNISKASLVPFTGETDSILSWTLGTRIPPTAHEEFVGAMQQVRNADRRLKRPLMADFTGLEHVYSRHDLMMGVSRNMLHTSFSFGQYRDWLIQKRDLAQPGTFLWTWIQTEPAAIHAEQREAAGRTPAVVEPEQIRLQVYAALSAGYRGVGFWKRKALDSRTEGADERRLAITQLNLELELLEPWLASGTIAAQVPFSVPSRETPRFGRSSFDFRNTKDEIEEGRAILQENKNQRKREREIDGELKAALIKSDLGKLLLPVWYETNSQFVPGQMAAKNVSIVVPIGDSSSVWLVTTTEIHSLQREQVTGGIRITIPLLDQTAAVLFTSDLAVIESLRRKIKRIEMKSARVSIDLAAAKLERVRRVDGELQQVHTGQPDAPQLLTKARNWIEIAEAAFKRGDFHAARERASEAMQYLRILQRAHWNVAVSGLSSPVSSLHTVSFQTLPDYWRMVSRLGRSSVKLDANLLRSGDFEDIQTMVVDGWGHSQNQVEGIRADADLYPSGFKGSYALRLIAVPETGQDAPPSVIVKTPVTVTTPPVLVHSGQIIHVSGWARVVSPVVGHLDGVMLYDNIGGQIGALRWKDQNTWQRFEIVRDVERSGPFQLTVSLNGMGEIQFDELKIVPHSPQSIPVAGEDSRSQEDKSAGSRTRDFLNRFSGLRPPSFGKR
jgi:hypothetical protein